MPLGCAPRFEVAELRHPGGFSVPDALQVLYREIEKRQTE